MCFGHRNRKHRRLKRIVTPSTERRITNVFIFILPSRTKLTECDETDATTERKRFPQWGRKEGRKETRKGERGREQRGGTFSLFLSFLAYDVIRGERGVVGLGPPPPPPLHTFVPTTLDQLVGCSLFPLPPRLSLFFLGVQHKAAAAAAVRKRLPFGLERHAAAEAHHGISRVLSLSHRLVFLFRGKIIACDACMLGTTYLLYLNHAFYSFTYKRFY